MAAVAGVAVKSAGVGVGVVWQATAPQTKMTTMNADKFFKIEPLDLECGNKITPSTIARAHFFVKEGFL